jgi:cytochrome P450
MSLNFRSILHDPVFYQDSLVYNPDRFLKNGQIDSSVRDPTVASFGFGRRICPGRFFSDAGLFASVTHVLTVFCIKPSLDENGNEVEIVPSMTSGVLS